MTNKNKIKGTNFENLVVSVLNKYVNKSNWKRVPGSGALGTILDEPILMADVKGTVEGISRAFKVECKVGYGGEKQFTLKKEWLDKIRQEADTGYFIPLLIGKFLGARAGTKVFVVMDIDSFIDIINIASSKDA